jgi:hypothetical protein
MFPLCQVLACSAGIMTGQVTEGHERELEFQIYDLSLQSLLASFTLKDGAAITHDHNWLNLTARNQLYALGH